MHVSCRRFLGPCIVIIILGFAVYANCLNGGFVWDDGILIRDNACIKNWSGLAKVFTQDVGAGAKKEYGFYRPFQILTYTIDYTFWNLNVLGFHLSNVLLHILAALCIFWLVNILYDDSILSLLTALFFVSHPIHTEAVSYVSGRSDSLAAIFMLLCLIFYIKNLSQKSRALYILMLLSYILALLSRENSLVLPLILLLYHYTVRKRFERKQFLALSAFAFIYIGFRFTLLKSFLPDFPISTNLMQRFPGFFAAVANYLRLLFLPFNLHMEYGNKLFSFSHPQVVFGILISLTLLIYAAAQIKAKPLTSFSILWFFATLLPYSNLYPLNAYMAEHWLYLPSVGFFLIIAKALSYLYRSTHLKAVSLALIISLLAFYSCLTIRQNSYWQDPLTLYQRTLKYAPDSAMAHNNLGNTYYRLGNKKKAIASYKRAIAANPYYAKAYNNLGFAYYHLGKKEEAVSLYKKAAAARPDYAQTYNNLAFVYYDMGEYDLAIEHCRKAVELGCEVNPQFLATLKSLEKSPQKW